MKWRTVYKPTKDEKKTCPHQLNFSPDEIGIVIQCSKCNAFFHSVGMFYKNKACPDTFQWAEGCNHPEDAIEKYYDDMAGYVECTVCGTLL